MKQRCSAGVGTAAVLNGDAVMRRIAFIAIGVLLSALPGRAQTDQSAAPDEGISCFVSAPAPDYPLAALDEHVDGSVWTWTTVTAQGTIDKIDTEVVSAWNRAPKLLTPPRKKLFAKQKSSRNARAGRFG
jgi:hypothetical protein